MAFNRSNSVFSCPPDCPKRCVGCQSKCPTYAKAKARDAELKAAARRGTRGLTDAKSILIESRLKYKRDVKLTK